MEDNRIGDKDWVYAARSWKGKVRNEEGIFSQWVRGCMGYVYVDIVVKGKFSRNVRALVDTGSAYIVLDSNHF